MTPSVAGVSGGRTSAMMALGLPRDVVLTFQNTGREHERTLDFLCKLEDDLGREIVRLEWRPPPKRGDPPRLFSHAVVSHAELARRGEPFWAMLEALAAYRETKGEAPLAPWANSRLCTAYLKIMVQHRYAGALFGEDEDYVAYVGIRADEGWRTKVRGARACVELRFPLHEAGVVKADVLRFWSRKSYDLDLPEFLGNCVGCFMKDERDLASALALEESDAPWWSSVEERFGPMRRGGRPSYAQVAAELPHRLAVRGDLAAGREPTLPEGMSPRRFRLVVRQEREPTSEPWSCGCAGADLLAAGEEVPS